MAQQHHELTGSAAAPMTGDALAAYLRAQATEFLRALRLHRETGGGTPNGGAGHSADAARALRRSARRVSGSLHTFRPLLDPDWSEEIRPELAWLSGTLALEHACEARLERLLLALHRLSGATPMPTRAAGAGTGGTGRPPGASPAETATATSAGAAAATAKAPASAADIAAPPTPATAPPTVTTTSVTTTSPAAAPPPAAAAVGADTDPRTTGTALGTVTGTNAAPTPAVPTPATPASLPLTPSPHPPTPDRAHLTVGAAKAGALLDRQLTLARTRAHSTALQALGSARFHAVADKVAVLASEVPLAPAAADADLRPFASAAEERLTDAVAALPLITAGHPYNAEALIHGLSPDPAPHPQDAPWHQVRLLLRLHRYALEVLYGGDAPLDVRLLSAGEALDRHRDAAEAAAAAAHAARTPRIAPATAYALGVLHADQRHEVEAARYAFQRAWQKQTIGTLGTTTS
ncbi:CHAD domain-containing protein [Streptomyces sp. NPDC002328]|uniref:CHAD domain-containing protein n=1 Tax=Streptomyces sp. NPDC002328 TaxID=3364642 RepID=UPI0036D051EC